MEPKQTHFTTTDQLNTLNVTLSTVNNFYVMFFYFRVEFLVIEPKSFFLQFGLKTLVSNIFLKLIRIRMRQRWKSKIFNSSFEVQISYSEVISEVYW